MNLADLFERAVKRLRREPQLFGVCGGIAASLYRRDQRFTRNIDIMLPRGTDSIALACSIIEDNGLTPHQLRVSDLYLAPMMNKKRGPVALVVGRHATRPEIEPGLDFLTGSLEWVPNALTRAQDNQRDFGFGPVPCITIEDLILAKALVRGGADRGGRDIDDLTSIFSAQREIDLAYLAAQLDRFRIALPRELDPLLPKALSVASRRIRGQGRKR